ncbi:MAG: hypothetical protein NW220_03650 [Leptolyngbyaceae cyanobacterium bins.349]|nr:hypothetical protein [Leptolyngbyaceae cyanobacterium bins.349]
MTTHANWVATASTPQPYGTCSGGCIQAIADTVLTSFKRLP